MKIEIFEKLTKALEARRAEAMTNLKAMLGKTNNINLTKITIYIMEIFLSFNILLLFKDLKINITFYKIIQYQYT